MKSYWIDSIKNEYNIAYPTNPICDRCWNKPYYSNTILNYKYCPFCGVKKEKICKTITEKHYKRMEKIKEFTDGVAKVLERK